ncbi:MAG: GNAT family N-acetyltransferase [Chitinophagaceae bacterium]|nr:MAG: GNAT family N-acetyltransferase [Chitinophagaceae bacterium]
MHLIPGIAKTENDLHQILALQEKNLKQHLSEDQKSTEGFLTMQFSFELMNNLHKLAPSIVVRDEDKIIGYAIVLLKEGRTFYTDLEGMFVNLEKLQWKGVSLADYKFYVMGQICVDKDYRGQNVFAMLYEEHKNIYKDQFDFIVTEISTSNARSNRAHEKTGFKVLDTYRDHLDEWNVVLWDWS